MTQILEGIHQIAVHASDLDRSIAFYRDVLGAELLAKFDPPGLAFFRFGTTRMLLEKGGPKATIYFRVADIHASYRLLQSRGVPFEGAPHAIHRDAEGHFGPAGETEWMAFFYDPDRNLLAIASRIA